MKTLADVALLTERVRPDDTRNVTNAADAIAQNMRSSVYLLGWALVVEAASDAHLMEHVDPLAVYEVHGEWVDAWLGGWMAESMCDGGWLNGRIHV